MKVITLLNEKGGVGKTTLATHIAAGLAADGRQVVLIDADPQGSATRVLGLERFGGLYRYMVQDEAFQDVLTILSPEVYTPKPNEAGFLGVIRGNIETRNIATSISSITLFDELMTEISTAFDYAIVDTSPTPSLLHTTMILGSDFVLMPTVLETMSLEGLYSTVEHLKAFFQQRVSLLNKPVGLLGIVPTMAKPRTVEHSENLAELKEKFGDYVWCPITSRIAWAEATTWRKPVWMLDNDDKAASEAWRMVRQTEKAVKTNVE